MKKTSFKALAADERFITLSERNKKLVPTENVKFLIWNLPSVITCPFATAHCKEFCYAEKAEKAYPNCLPSRLEHFRISREPDFIERMIYTIEAYLIKPSYKNAKKVVVRIHESGDFYNQQYAINWVKIAEHFKYNKKVVFMAYTKSITFFSDNVHSEVNHKQPPKNMVVRFSIWDDTNYWDLRSAKRWQFPTYSAVDTFTKEIPSQNRCRCKDCATCGKCWGKTKNIICEIH